MHPAVVTKYGATFRSRSRFHRYGRNIFQCVFSESDEVNKSRRATPWSAITILPYFPGFTFPSHQHFSVSSVKSILAILFQITADISFTKCTRNYWPFPFPSILTPKFLRFHFYNILISAHLALALHCGVHIKDWTVNIKFQMPNSSVNDLILTVIMTIGKILDFHSSNAKDRTVAQKYWLYWQCQG